ncbi:MAG: HAD hydrolase family protein [Clostridia bacterium]|nr:HAD hydrolase family protein [Clostridia bacterium]
MNNKKRLICLDLDGTLTQHRSQLGEKNKAVLDKLSEKYKLLMVGAGNVPRIYGQMNEYPIDILGNYGMQEGKMIDGKMVIVRQDTQEVDREFFIEKTNYLREKYGYTEYKGEPIEFHASGMVTFPFLGTKAEVADKLAFDPDRAKRKVLYPEVLEIFKDYTVYIGGSSSFDFSAKKYNKYDAIVTYAKENGYELDEILYVGDDFGDGGGDSHVRLGGLDYINVTDYEKFGDLMKDYL